MLSNTVQMEYMRIALELAKQAADEGEVPVGAVVVCEGKVVGTGRNRREKEKNALCHAEIEAIDNACKTLGGWRLHKCELYVTLEPCPMCSGAIINSRIKRLVYGAADKKSGCAESVLNLFEMPFNHKPEIVSGVMEDECREVLQNFFSRLRKSKAQQKS